MKIIPNIIPFTKQSLSVKWEVVNLLKKELNARKHQFIGRSDVVYKTIGCGWIRAIDLCFGSNIMKEQWFYGYEDIVIHKTKFVKLQKMVSDKYLGTKWKVELLDHYHQVWGEDSLKTMRIKISKRSYENSPK